MAEARVAVERVATGVGVAGGAGEARAAVV
jgi:hypothetical protein